MSTPAFDRRLDLDALLAERARALFPDVAPAQRPAWLVALADSLTVPCYDDWSGTIGVPSCGPQCPACLAEEEAAGRCPPGSCPDCTQLPDGTWP